MRKVIELNAGKTVYLFTTQGHTYVGVLEGLVDDDVVEMIAPDAATRMHINLSDVSGVRIYDEESEVAP